MASAAAVRRCRAKHASPSSSLLLLPSPLLPMLLLLLLHASWPPSPPSLPQIRALRGSLRAPHRLDQRTQR
jgi:hypothetical protein